MKVLVLGSDGQLGRSLKDSFKKTPYKVIFSKRADIDITNLNDTQIKIKNISPKIIVNASAYTFVDLAEEEIEKARKVNHIAVQNLAEIAKKLNCWLIHLSTDYVFDGRGIRAYKENDQTNPTCIYGITKLDGEEAIRHSGCKYLIIRTSWVFGEHGNNFLKKMIYLAAEKDVIEIVSDQFGCPTYSHDIADAIISVFQYLDLNFQSGTYHYAGKNSSSWADFARVIFKEALDLGILFKEPEIIPILSKDFITAAERPKNSKLDSSLFKKTFAFPPSDWQHGVRSALRSLK